MALGLDAEALVIGEAVALRREDAAFHALWDRAAIEADYRFWIAQLTASEARVATLPLEPAARETLLLGQAVIRAINLDPLLPDDLVHTALRRRRRRQWRATTAPAARSGRASIDILPGTGRIDTACPPFAAISPSPGEQA
ncbi:hypothetical protein AB5I41_26550 [Sphingomonas sp. MMS24-JH45]